MSLILIIFLILPAFFIACNSSDINDIFLTEEEINWLKEHEGQIRIGYTTDYPPIEFLKNGEYVGITADFFKLLEEKLGIEIEMVEYDSWPKLLDDAKNWKVSGITAASKTEQRLEYLNFTVPYIFNPNVIITRKNFSEKLSFEKLNNSSMSILAVEDFSVLDELKLLYPDLKYETVPNAKEGLRKISFGEADAMIVQLISASQAIDEDNITNLVVNTETVYDSNLSIATRNDWPILNDIFNKGLARITQAERDAIKSKWIPLHRKSFYEEPHFLMALAGGLIFLILIFIIIFFWNITLKEKVNQKTSELEKSKEELLFKSYHDELTGLYNRAYYNEKIKYFSLNPNLPLSVAIADLNGLKITNDTLGHESGDKLIKKVAEILENETRKKDTIARIGGDEFIILMPNTSKEEAETICENIEKACTSSKDCPIFPSLAIGLATQTESYQSFQSVFNKAEDIMYEKKKITREETYKNIINSLKIKLENSTFETLNHRKRIQNLVLKVGERLSLSEDDILDLEVLADLHDIGKVGIPHEILHKKEPLTLKERNKIEEHPDLGFRIVNTSKMNKVAYAILCHHEHWDGSGYPNGLKGENIPLISRILSVVDAYEVMTTGRPYKKAVSKEEALKELKRCSKSQFDPKVVNAFLEII